MALLKYIVRLRRMDDLIRRKATGPPAQFSSKLGLCKSVMMEDIRDLKDLGASIKYCRLRRSYYYDRDFTLTIGPIEREHQAQIKGGNFYFSQSAPSDYTGITAFTFVASG